LIQTLLQEAGMSKQAFHQHKIQNQTVDLIRNWVINQILNKRRFHPVMGLKKICASLKDSVVGRDKFIAIGMKANLNISLPRSYTRTTFSTKSNKYQNLLVDKLLDNINQLWVTDITYFRLGEVFYYICLIMDVYSRRILGYHVADSLHAELCLVTLKMALKNRAIKNFDEQLIHHSDKGTQYIFHQYIGILEDSKILISMCNSPYENAHMERLNGIIKNEYLIPMKIQSFDLLKKALSKVVKLYNEDRLHWEINTNPIQYEQQLKTLPKCQRTIMKIFVEESTKVFQQKIKNQLQLF
jgi:putative transposase